MRCPARHWSQCPQLPPNQPTATRSPTSNPATPSPTSATVPAISWPGVTGQLNPGAAPETNMASLPHIPQAATSSRTWPGSGAVVSTSARAKSAPAEGTCTAR